MTSPTDRKPDGAECANTPPRFILPTQKTGILSRRQIEVLNSAARGMNNREIAAEVGLSAQTVRHHLMATRYKLNARNTTHAVAIALSDHLITLED